MEIARYFDYCRIKRMILTVLKYSFQGDPILIKLSGHISGNFITDD
jgi:hypothetical protein